MWLLALLFACGDQTHVPATTTPEAPVVINEPTPEPPAELSCDAPEGYNSMGVWTAQFNNGTKIDLHLGTHANVSALPDSADVVGWGVMETSNLGTLLELKGSTPIAGKFCLQPIAIDGSATAGTIARSIDGAPAIAEAARYLDLALTAELPENVSSWLTAELAKDANLENRQFMTPLGKRPDGTPYLHVRFAPPHSQGYPTVIEPATKDISGNVGITLVGADGIGRRESRPVY